MPASLSAPRGVPRHTAHGGAFELQTGWLIPILLMVTFAMATFRLAWLGPTYPLTVAPLGCLLLIVSCTTAAVDQRAGRTLLFGSLVLLLPLLSLLIVKSGRVPINTDKFPTSYSLWLANFAMLFWALASRTSPAARSRLTRSMYLALIVLTAFGLVQGILANLVGVTALYNIWGSFSYTGPRLVALFWKNGFFRASSFYYEPSLFGRTAICVLTALLILNKRPLLALAISGVAVLVSFSAGSVIFWAGALAIWLRGYRERPGKSLAVSVSIAVAAALAAPLYLIYLLSRIGEIQTAQYNSGYVRVMLPLRILGGIMADFPMGAPLGNNSILASTSSIFTSFSGGEGRITSGIYEIVMYTGWVGILGFAAILLYGAYAFLVGRWRLALMIYVILFATVVSSSFLAFESTISLLPVILSFKAFQDAAVAARSPQDPQ